MYNAAMKNFWTDGGMLTIGSMYSFRNNILF